MFDTLRELLQTNLNLETAVQNRLLLSLGVLFGLWLARLIVVHLANRRYADEPRLLYTWRKAADYTAVILGVFLIGRLWLEGIQSLATYLGLLSAGLAIALQDLVINLAGWAFVIWRRPFVVGDRIEIGAHAGDVIDVRLFQFSLLEIGKRIQAEQSTGRIIHVPNGQVFKDALVNYSQGLPFIWNEIPVMVTFESDWEKAKRLLETILAQHAPDVQDAIKRYQQRADKRFVISYRNVTPTIYTAVVSSGVLLTLRYMVDPRKRRSSEQAIWEDVLRAFGQHWDIDFAYETVREYLHFHERKQPPIHEAPTAVLKRPRPEPSPDTDT